MNCCIYICTYIRVYIDIFSAFDFALQLLEFRRIMIWKSNEVAGISTRFNCSSSKSVVHVHWMSEAVVWMSCIYKPFMHASLYRTRRRGNVVTKYTDFHANKVQYILDRCYGGQFQLEQQFKTTYNAHCHKVNAAVSNSLHFIRAW